MKIAFLNLYSGQIERGAETFTHELAHRLQTDHQISFLKGNTQLLPQSQFSGSILNRSRKRLFIDKPSLEVLRFTLSQISNLISRDYDIVVPLNGFWQLLILKLIQPFKHFKIIVIGNSGPGWDERWNLYLHPNYFVATTKPTLVWAHRTCFYTKSVLVPYAIDKKKFQVKPAMVNLPKPVILCPAALVPYKRIDLAIKAVARLEQGSLLVMGKGPLENQLQDLGRKLLPGRFLLTSVTNTDMPAYFQSADIITLPSHPQENSPMVFLEAIAAGKMVVATDSPRNRWLLSGSAVFVDPTKLEPYAQALDQAIHHGDPDPQTLSKFSWDRVLNQYQQLFMP